VTRAPKLLVGLTTFVILLLPTCQATAGSRSEEHENEAVVYRGATACGVERWTVKTGMDAGARQVNQKAVVNTTIFHLRSLRAPGFLPSTSRIRPVETTVWRVSGTLLRVKEEQDSDFHLVIADSGGRTMITEIPAPACVSSSPFLPSERYVRSLFIADFHPSTSWQRPNVKITVKGVGYFDYLHGQSGVAPNGIELHPLLGFTVGTRSSAVVPPPPPVPTATQVPAPTSTASPTATSTPITPTSTSTSTPSSSVSVTARVSNAYPPRYSTVTVYGQLTGAGAGVTMNTTWHYKTTTSSCSGVTDGSGLASCSRDIGGATAGYFVSIDVSFSYGGRIYVAQTGFTPQ
jgi:hypothetical protein